MKISCHNCGHLEEVSKSFCTQCGQVVSFHGSDYFSVFGVPCHFQINLEDLKKKYYQGQRELHPDRFIGSKDALKRSQAEARSAFLNEAYRTLSQSSLRREYLLELSGFKIEDAGNKAPVELAEEFFDIQDALSDGDIGRAKQLQDELFKKDQKMEAEITLFERQADETQDEQKRSEIGKNMLNVLVTKRYLDSMIRDLAAKLGSHG